MFNKNTMNIAKFDFLNTLKSKGYIILNIVLCLLVVVALNLSSIIELFKTSGLIHTVGYVLEVWETGSGLLFESIASNVDDSLIKEVKKSDIKLEYDYDNIDEKTVGINILSNADGIIETVEIISKDTISDSVTEYITSVLTKARNSAIKEKYDMSEEDAVMYKQNVELNEVILSNAKNQNELTTIISTFVGYIIFMLVMTITTTVASSVANEKTSKSAEYILSTVPAKDYLNGKVLAANLKTILTIILMVFYCLLGLVINTVIMPTITDSTTAIDTSTVTGINFNILVYLGIIIFMIFMTNTIISYIQAFLASKIKSISELDNAIMLPTVILVVAYFVSSMLPNTNNILTYILSCTPILSMYILPTAYMLNKVNAIGILISFTVLTITLVVVYKVVSSKFKNNLLDLGKKKTEKENEDLEVRRAEENKLLNSKFKKFITCVAFALILSITLGNVVGVIPYFVQNENLRLVLNSLVFIIYIGVPAWVLNKLLNNSAKTRKEKSEGKISTKQKMKAYLIGLAGLVLAQIINTIFVTMFGVEQSDAMDAALTVPSSTIGILLYILYLAVIPAIFEELLFRKAILSGAKKFGSAFAIIFTSVLFGMFHQNLQQLVGTTLIGLILAYVTVKTKDIKVSQALHFTNNFFAVIVQIIYSEYEIGIVTNLSLISLACILLIAIFVIIGIILLIKSVVQKEKIFKIENENKYSVNKASMFTNYYALILLVTIVFTTILNSNI